MGPVKIQFENGRDFWEKSYPYIVTAIFLTLSILLIWRHEFWRDEIYSWHLGSESLDLKRFVSNMRTGAGHPYLWFTMLYFISHFITQNPESMKILHLVISTISVFLILKYAPFNKIIKVMLVFGYFFFYEYSIISRNYALGVLCIVIFCILYKNKYKNILPITIVLFFMGQANLYSFIISIALFLMLIIELITERKLIKNNIKKVNIVLLIVIVFAGIFFLYLQIGEQALPSLSNTTASLLTNRSPEENSFAFRSTIESIIKTYIHIPQFILSFWESNIIIYFLSKFNILWMLIFTVVLFIIPFFIVKRKCILLYIIGFIGIILSNFYINRFYVRHFGNLFLLFIACIWISNIDKGDKYLINTKGNFNKIFQSTFLIIILISSLIASSVAFYFDWKYPFSNGKYVAEYIEENFDKDNMVIVGYKDYSAETFAGYLNKDVYYPNSRDFKKLVSHTDRTPIVSIEDIFEDSYFFTENSKTVLTILIYSNPDREILEKYFFKKLDVEFINSIVPNENYYLYLFDKDIFSKEYLSNMVYRIDKSNFEEYFRPMNECEFVEEEDATRIKVYGDDPWFETTFPFEFNENSSMLAYFNIDSFVDGEFIIFFKRPNRDCIIEDSLPFRIRKGNNIIYLKIPYSEDLEGLRIDPIDVKGDCLIREVKFYSLEG